MSVVSELNTAISLNKNLEKGCGVSKHGIENPAEFLKCVSLFSYLVDPEAEGLREAAIVGSILLKHLKSTKKD